MALSGASRGVDQKGNRKRNNNANIAPTDFVDILGNDCANVISPTFYPPVSQFAYLPAVNSLNFIFLVTAYWSTSAKFTISPNELFLFKVGV